MSARPRCKQRLISPISPARRAELAAILRRRPGHRSAAQRARLLEALLSSPDGIATGAARSMLDVWAPPARVAELRRAGVPILAERVAEDIGGSVHRNVARYWLAPSVACQLRETEAPALAELVASADVAEMAP